jgi:hypothetical protein
MQILDVSARFPAGLQCPLPAAAAAAAVLLIDSKAYWQAVHPPEG